jgi:hypothetical protein
MSSLRVWARGRHDRRRSSKLDERVGDLDDLSVDVNALIEPPHGAKLLRGLDKIAAALETPATPGEHGRTAGESVHRRGESDVRDDLG